MKTQLLQITKNCIDKMVSETEKGNMYSKGIQVAINEAIEELELDCQTMDLILENDFCSAQNKLPENFNDLAEGYIEYVLELFDFNPFEGVSLQTTFTDEFAFLHGVTHKPAAIAYH